MKKIVLLLSLIITLAFSNIKAQMKMTSDGNFDVETIPAPNAWTKFQVNFNSANTSPSGRNYAFYTTNTPCGNLTYGIYAKAYSSSVFSGRAYGIYAVAGNCSSGYNYGIYGAFSGASGTNGAGIYGAANGYSDMDVAGNWAGYFNGNLKVNGVSYANSFSLNSDKRLKKEIKPITSITFDKISQLNAVSYKLKKRQELKADGTIPTDTSKSDTVNGKFINKIHYGYLAQDLQQIFPELIYQGDDGFLAVDYIGLIPLMMEEIKQQNATITSLQQQINNCCAKVNKSNQKTSDPNNENVNNSASLYQNTPNPFSQQTQIKCFIPDNAMISNIYIYDMQGTQLKKIQINSKGDETITIQGAEFKAGMYMFTLIIDGKVIDTKKMILTD